MKYKKPSPRDLRRVNRTEILRKIYFEGPISRLEVSQQIGISPATVTNIVNDLLDKNIISEPGVRRADSGRPSTMMVINPDYGYFIGIEVGETSVQVELFDISFNSCKRVHFDLAEKQITPARIVSEMVKGIDAVMNMQGIIDRNLVGIGIGFPGLVDPSRGVSVFTPNWGWHDVSITDLLREHTSVPMMLDNGAKTMAMGEALFGAGQGVNNLAVLLVGTGVGGAVISDRSLFRGAFNNAGEFGHTTLNVEGPECLCGSRGCLEVYVGANNVINRYRELVGENAEQPSEEDQIGFINYLISEAEKGNPDARKVVDETIRYLGVGMANMINVVNPQLLLLGGWSGLVFGSKYLQEIKKAASNYALQQSFTKTEIRLCQLGQESVAKGAASLLLEHFFETAGESERLVVGGRAVGKK